MHHSIYILVNVYLCIIIFLDYIREESLGHVCRYFLSLILIPSTVIIDLKIPVILSFKEEYVTKEKIKI